MNERQFRNRLLFAFSICLVVSLYSCAVASACHRCGVFGRRCSYARSYPVQTATQKYVAPQVPDNVQTFVFNNAAPPTQSLYGYQSQAYQAAVQPYTASAQELLAVASETNSTLRTITTLASEQLRSETEVNRLLGASQALQNVINSARETTAQSTVSSAWVLQLKNGEITKFERLRGRGAQPDQQPGDGNSQPVTNGTILNQTCARCHGPDKTSPAGGVFIHDEATIPASAITKALRWARDPSQAPGDKMKEVFGSLTDQEKAGLMDALLDREG